MQPLQTRSILTFDLLYPTPESGEDDFIELARQADPPALVRPVYFPWPDDVDDLADLPTRERYDAVRRLGSESHLRTSIPPLIAKDTRPDAMIFGVTSASFLQGPEGVAQQLDTLAGITGTPVTSTTAAFQRALGHLGISRVSLASIYHRDGSQLFVDRLAEAGVETVGRYDFDAGSDREVATWSAEQITDLVMRSLSTDAQAVVVPETALHTAGLGSVLDAAAGRPVLTATQVSLWDAYRLAGVSPVATAAGVLFAKHRS